MEQSDIEAKAEKIRQVQAEYGFWVPGELQRRGIKDHEKHFAFEEQVLELCKGHSYEAITYAFRRVCERVRRSAFIG